VSEGETITKLRFHVEARANTDRLGDLRHALGVPWVGRLPVQAFVEDAPEGVDVGPPVHLLWGHVVHVPMNCPVFLRSVSSLERRIRPKSVR
jgi:hypothetical protein